MNWNDVVELIKKLNSTPFCELTSKPSVDETYFLKKTLNVMPEYGDYTYLTLDYYIQSEYTMELLIEIYINDDKIIIDNKSFKIINLKDFDAITYTLTNGRPSIEMLSHLEKIKEILDDMG